ncbi:MAG: C25 family cysteine peptidase [Candidatus Methanofastidiosia archaeon]|jgi:hypothetical protein
MNLRRNAETLIMVVMLCFGIFTTCICNAQATESISVPYNFETPVIETVEGFHKVTIEGMYNLYKVGKPILPFGLAKILLPQGHEIQDISIMLGEEKTMGENFNVEMGKKQEHLYEMSNVGSNYPAFTGTFPETYFDFLRIQVYKGYKIAFIRLYPVHYNGQTGEITYVNEITVTVDTILKEKDPEKTFRGLESDCREVQSMVHNPWTAKTYTQDTRYSARIPPGAYDYVIITSDALQPSFQNLANWKNSKNISTTIVTTSYIYSNYTGADNQEQIRNFIVDAYTTWNIMYVLLGGDVEIIPHRGVYGIVNGSSANDPDTDIPCDLYYGGLDGTWDDDGDSIFGEGDSVSGGTGTAGEEADFLYEVYVGRAPVSDATEAANFINKTIAFESASVVQNASMWGELLWSGPDTWGGDHKDEIIAYFPGSYSITTYYDRDGTASTANWIASVNAGQNFVNHAAHSNLDSMGKINRSDVDSSITNASDFCLIYSWGCYAASFDNRWSNGTYDPDDCIAEHFVHNATGAFAFVGNSRYGWGTIGSTAGTSHQFDKEFFDAIFNENILNVGVTLADSKQDLLGNVGSTGAYRWVYCELNLLGDPETPLLGFSPLSSSIVANPGVVDVGQQITVTMTVFNNGGSQINTVTPSALNITTTGTAAITLFSGPAPAQADIPSGNSQDFTWVYTVDSGDCSDTISFSGNAAGTDSGTGTSVFSSMTTSNIVRIEICFEAYPGIFSSNTFFVVGDTAYCTDVLGTGKIAYGLAVGGVTNNPEGRTDVILTPTEHDTGNLIIVGGPAVNPVADEFDTIFGITYIFNPGVSFQIDAEGESIFLDLQNYPERDICIVYLGEHNGRYILLVWGYGWEGTYAGSMLLGEPQTWQTYQDSHLLLLRWIDSNGDGLVQIGEITVESFT